VLDLTLRARAIDRATPRTRIISVELDAQAFGFVAGQAVFAGLASSPVRRPYSIACSPEQAAREGAIELLVQIDDHAAPDPHLELAERGTALSIQGPFGSFSLPRGHDEHPLLLVAGGTGIAPLRSMMWHRLETAPDAPLIKLLYSARSPEEFAYAEELTRLAAAGRIQLLRTVTRTAGADWDGTRGRLNRELLTRLIDEEPTRCVLCGPAALVADAGAILKDFGVPENWILTETYAG
jgi:NAD(P)H-flavin reductase